MASERPDPIGTAWQVYRAANISDLNVRWISHTAESAFSAGFLAGAEHLKLELERRRVEDTPPGRPSLEDDLGAGV